jgi:hypothetical protein
MAVIIRNRKLEGSAASNHSPRKVVRREIGIERLRLQPGRHLEPGSRDARLQDVEDRLLAKMVATHENRERALDRLLHDVLDESNTDTTPRALPFKGDACISRRLRRTEDLLVAAVIENHPNAERGLDRLIDDLFPVDVPAPEMEWDNDWDGLA